MIREAGFTYGFMCVYIVVHSSAYFIALRQLRVFSKERVIFLYHLASFFLSLVLLLLLRASDVSTFTTEVLIGILALHAIYSLSFLELWALADDSYSIAILNRVHNNGPIRDIKELFDLRGIGERKQRNRLKSVMRLRLVTIDNQTVSLTPAGRLVAKGSCYLLRIANIKQ